MQHRVDTIDAQPSNESGGILVLVTGALMVSIEWIYPIDFDVVDCGWILMGATHRSMISNSR